MSLSFSLPFLCFIFCIHLRVLTFVLFVFVTSTSGLFLGCRLVVIPSRRVLWVVGTVGLGSCEIVYNGGLLPGFLLSIAFKWSFMLDYYGIIDLNNDPYVNYVTKKYFACVFVSFFQIVFIVRPFVVYNIRLEFFHIHFNHKRTGLDVLFITYIYISVILNHNGVLCDGLKSL